MGSSGTPNESLKDAFAADGFSRRLVAARVNALLGLASMAVFLVAILLSKVFYQLVEAFMWGVALLTLIGLLWAAPNAEALHALPDFIKACLYRIDRCHGLIFLNHVYLPRHLLQPARPGRLNLIFLCISCVAYFLLAVGYLLTVTEIVQ